MLDHYDVVVVGSGYGGSIAASRLARAGRTVCLVERGEEKRPGDYPNRGVGLLSEVQFDSPAIRAGSHTALFDVRYNKDINVVVGCGLGGTSLINAGICIRPDGKIFATSAWPAELRSESTLDSYFDIVEEMLRPSLPPNAYLESSKTSTLGKAATQLGQRAVPVPVLVNFEHLKDNINHVGVMQGPCVGCGDCVSGCNYHAKNTLIMNYLPDATAHSAAIFTRARVRYVEQAHPGWSVYGQTVDRKGAGRAFKVGAKVVIMAAGTLGSTEILLRSREEGLPLSSQIGNRFSGNGDTIGFAYNTEHVINGMGLGTLDVRRRPPVGPCSTVIVPWRSGSDAESGMLMADGTVPGALANLLPPLNLLAPLLGIGTRLKGADTSQGVRKRIKKLAREIESALLGPHAGAMRNTLFMLLMAYDASMGRMHLEGGRLRIDWPGLGEQEQFRRASEVMHQVTRALDGTYIRNPVWNKLTDYNMVTGHPLGGCAMADSADSGVVNHKGQVFSGATPDSVHAGLYVMDGSVVPTALGVNPLLTISALAERSCHELARDYGWAINYDLE